MSMVDSFSPCGRRWRAAPDEGSRGIRQAGATPHPSSQPIAALPGELSLSRKGRGDVSVSGHASLWGVADLNGDVVARGAFAVSLMKGGPVRMLHQHETRAPMGVWDEVVEDERGLFVRGRIMDWSPDARFAQALARAGAMDGLSIGYRAVRARRDGRLRVLSEVELWEVSLVVFPMEPKARFRVVRE